MGEAEVVSDSGSAVADRERDAEEPDLEDAEEPDLEAAENQFLAEPSQSQSQRQRQSQSQSRSRSRYATNARSRSASTASSTGSRRYRGDPLSDAAVEMCRYITSGKLSKRNNGRAGRRHHSLASNHHVDRLFDLESKLNRLTTAVEGLVSRPPGYSPLSTLSSVDPRLQYQQQLQPQSLGSSYATGIDLDADMEIGFPEGSMNAPASGGP